jgi:hypothetical protein
MTKADFIWAKPPFEKHHSVDFRKKFTVKNATEGIIKICAESDFVLYLDGVEILRNQYQDYPEYLHYQETEFKLSDGEHVLAVEGYYCGDDFQTMVKKDTPFLYLDMEFGNGEKIVSDSSFKVRRSPILNRSRLDKVNRQLGMVFCVDMRLADNWKELNYDDSDWENAEVVMNQNLPKTITPVKLHFLPTIKGKIIKNTTLLRDLIKAENETFAESAYNDQLNVAANEANGSCLIFDLGGEEFGFLEVQVNADKGTIVDISHGEHLEKNRVHSRMGERNFTDRLIACGGKSCWTIPRKIGGRYIQLNIIGSYCSADIVFHPIRAVEKCQLALAHGNKNDCILWQMSLKTLELCMGDHYMDCPWREQALYGYDSRHQMLFGYGVYGNYDYVKSNLSLLCRSIMPNGLSAITAPSILEPQIPFFSMILAPSMKELIQYSGDNSIYEQEKKSLKRIEAALLKNYSPESGLYGVPTDKGVWNFYEWCGELSCDNRLEQLPYQCYLAEALYAASDLHGWSGNEVLAEEYKNAADQLMKTADQYFWDEPRGCYTAFLPHTPQKYYEHVQSTMLLFNRSMPEERRQRVYHTMVQQKLERCTWYNWLYFARAMAAGSNDTRQYLQQRFLEEFMPFAFNGATALWELPNGGYAGRFGCSLCHGWSAIPAWYTGALLLGVTPLQPGFSQFRIQPMFLDEQINFQGEVPTPHGKIHITNNHGSICYSAPAAVTGKIEA